MTDDGASPGRSTIAVHGRHERSPDGAPVAPALFQSSTFTNPVGSSDLVRYSRYGNNPNQLAVAEKYALLEGADKAVFLASGMAATALAHLAVLRPGDHLLSSAWIYGGTRTLFEDELGRFGIEVTYIDPTKPRRWRNALRENTRALFIETPINPTVRVIDLSHLASLAREHGLALLVDATFASPINFRPLEHGADVVITSATKYLNGHSDVIGGAVAGSEPLVDEVLRLLRTWGPALDPHAAWLVDRGMRTLAVRMERHNANGMAVAEWARASGAFRAVHYPGLPEHPDHALATEVLDGYGGMVGLELDGGDDAVNRFLGRLELIRHAPSLAGVESLISEPRRTSHAHQTKAQRKAMGIPDGFLRLSCGIEDAADIIEDLEHALGR